MQSAGAVVPAWADGAQLGGVRIDVDRFDLFRVVVQITRVNY
jgi:hypothetical protein